MIRRFLGFGLLACFAIPAAAQTAEWKVAPQYDVIEYFSPLLYKVKKDRKMGVIDSDGAVKLRPAFDRISPFYEGIALIYDLDSEGLALRGIITEEGNVTMAGDGFYLLPEYPFFSEGFLPVRASSGKYGYLTTDLRPAFKFIEDEVRPFSEGMAAIGDEDGFYMLTSEGEAVPIELPNGEYAYGGTNYYNGRALLWDGYEEFYSLDDVGQIESLGKVNAETLRVDYLYRYGSGKGDNVEYAEYIPEVDADWYPAQSGGKWTLVNNAGKQLTPYQYESVKGFLDGVAIASEYGRYGLLTMVAEKPKPTEKTPAKEDDGVFFASVKKKNHTYTPGSSVNCEFRLDVPDRWVNADYAVMLHDKENGANMPLTRKGDTYSFKYTPVGRNNSEKKTYVIAVKDGDRTLWHGEETYQFNQKQKAKLTIVPKLFNKTANANNQCRLDVTIKNPSSSPVTTTVTLTGGGTMTSFIPVSTPVTIPAYGSKTVSGFFTLKKKVVMDGWYKVSVGDVTTQNKTPLQLKPR